MTIPFQLIGQAISRNHMVEKLDGGGVGAVYKAEGVVALKFLPGHRPAETPLNTKARSRIPLCLVGILVHGCSTAVRLPGSYSDQLQSPKRGPIIASSPMLKNTLRICGSNWRPDQRSISVRVSANACPAW